MIDPYMAFAIQPKVYGCQHRKEAKKNLDNLCKQIDGCMYVADMEYPAKLLAIPEGAITGFYDEERVAIAIACLFVFQAVFVQDTGYHFRRDFADKTQRKSRS